jgi:hypothetical protein
MTTTAVGYRDVGFRMSWGAVFGGTVVTLGVWLLLHTLGLAAGLSAIAPQDQGSLRGVGIGTGVWSVIAPLIALFVGGFVAAYTAGYFDRTSRVIHGVVVWGLTTLLGAIFVSMALAATVRAGVRTGAALTSAVAGASGMEGLGLNANDLMAPVNERLRQQGLPPVSPGQMEAVARDAVQGAVQSGRFDREAVITSLTRNTQISRAEAEQTAAQMEQAFNQRASELRQTALTAADRTGKALWAVFLALFLGLVSAVAGALVGGSPRTHGTVVEREVAPAGPGRHVPVETGV